MADSIAILSPPLVLIVHDDIGVAEALAITLEGIGAAPIQVNQTADARMVIQDASALTAVMSRCSLDLAQDQPLLSWVATHRPGLALIALCSTPGHTHDHLPAWCQLLSPPFDGRDLKRALAEARLMGLESHGSGCCHRRFDLKCG